MKREPDFTQLLLVLDKVPPQRPTLFEFFLNVPLYDHIAADAPVHDDGYDWARRRILANYRIGYDFCAMPGNTYSFKADPPERRRTYSINQGGVIKDRSSFERYAWEEPADYGAGLLEAGAKALPQGMKLVINGPGGVLENLVQLIGYEDLCLMSLDDPELLDDISGAIGQRILRYYELFVDHPDVGALICNDDWGFNHQTMLSPAALRRWVFPWHKRVVELAHRHGKPVILHSCGYAAKIMEDIIGDMGFDGKHSFEDKIQPIEEAYEQYAGRIALLGGIDLDFVCRATPGQIESRSHAMIQRTQQRGGWALGTGNSVPDYVPWENYFAMTRAATGFTLEEIMAR